ncbi:MAG: MFS transporter [Spirochaetales bacterium]|nr:MFS transporter [Spirochaetales bacterium]
MSNKPTPLSPPLRKGFYIGEKHEKLSVKTKLIFGWGDFFGGASINTISFFYLIFLTDVVNIPPSLAGTAIMISKLWDAFTDPLMGVITDRTRTRFGKRRPWFFLAIFTVFAGWVLLWNPVAFDSVKARFAYVLFSYMLFNTFSTMVLVPWVATQPLLTPNYDERTSINLFRTIFSFTGTIAGSSLPILVLRYADDIRMGYRLNALIMGLLFALPWIAITLHIKEPDCRKDPEPPPFKLKDFIEPLKIKTFRYMVGIYLCSLLSMDLVSSVVAYFIIYVRTVPFPTPWLVVLVTGVICGILFTQSQKLAHRIGKEKVFVISAVLFLIGIGLSASLGATSGLVMTCVIATTGVLGVMGCTIFPWTMFPDAADTGYLAWGRSRPGSFSGIMTLFRKLSSAFAIFIVGWILTLVGYMNPNQTNVGGGLHLENQIQPDIVIFTIRLMFFLMPFMVLVPGIILAWKYPLTEKLFEKLEGHIEFKKGRSATGELSESELEELKRKLL